MVAVHPQCQITPPDNKIQSLTTVLHITGSQDYRSHNNMTTVSHITGSQDFLLLLSEPSLLVNKSGLAVSAHDYNSLVINTCKQVINLKWVRIL